MASSRSPQARSGPATIRLDDIALSDRDASFHAPHGSDWLILGLLVVVLLANGAYVWHQIGWESRSGRAVFFGVVLILVAWTALLYTFKLSVHVRVGAHGLSIVRGPWTTELAWSETARLVERTDTTDGTRYRWVVALARDGRELQVREDMVGDYERFRAVVYERYRLWHDHGGTWGATNGGPFNATDDVSTDIRWWLIAFVAFSLPGAYFWVLLAPETGLTGPVLSALAVFALFMALRALLGRQRYAVDSRQISAKRALGTDTLLWRDVARVDRTRHPAGGVMMVVIRVARFALGLAARRDSRIQTFQWSPRVPEYLTLRGGGRHVRVRLHRLARPDEMLAWVEFYERIGRRGNAADRLRARAASAPQPGEALPADLSSASGPLDPWGAGRAGEHVNVVYDDGPGSRPAANEQPSWLGHTGASAPRAAPGAGDDDDAWLWDTNAMPNVHVQAQPAQPARPTPPTSPTHPAQPQQPAAYTQSQPQGRSSEPPAQDGWSWGWQPDQGGQPQQPQHPPQQPQQPQPPQQPQQPQSTSAPDEGDGLADSFAPWRDESWQPPQLPRFGPGKPGEDAQRNPWRQIPDDPER